MNNEDLFDLLIDYFGVEPDSDGEVRVDCPNCGKEAKRGQTHFSFSARGGHCFVCGTSWSLRYLAIDVGVIEARDRYTSRPSPRGIAKRQVQKQKTKRRMSSAEWIEYGRVFTSHPDLATAWREYKIVPEALARWYRLGLGCFPEGSYMSKCTHLRLTVPLIDTAGTVHGFRCRTIAGDYGGWRERCEAAGHAKWLSPAGTQMLLYNGQRIGEGPKYGVASDGLPPPDQETVLFVVENPIDAIQVEMVYGDARNVRAVATLGVTVWDDEWTERIREIGCRVLVAYDNDRPGNGGGAAGREAWLAEHGKDIEPNGVKLVNRLLKAGVKATLMDWGGYPLKTDIGMLVNEALGRLMELANDSFAPQLRGESGAGSCCVVV